MLLGPGAGVCAAALFLRQITFACKKQYQAGGKPSAVSVRLRLHALKRELYPWRFDVSKGAVQETIIDLGAAFRVFFTKQELTRV